MAREVAAAEARRFGRSAGMLSIGVGSAGLLTYVYFSLASHNLERDAVRRGRRPLVRGLRDDLGPLSARSSSCSRGRSPSARPRRADRPARCGSRRRSSSALAAGLRRRGARAPRTRSRTTSCRATRPSTGSSSPRSSPSPRASSPGASSPAAGASALYGALLLASRRRGCRSPSPSPSGSPAARPRWRSGSSPRRSSA